VGGVRDSSATAIRSQSPELVQFKIKVKSDGQECPSYTSNVKIQRSGRDQGCRSGLQIAVQLFGKLFHLFQFFVEVFGEEAFSQLLQVGIEGHTQR
jgi:hypothetical protein